MVLNLLELVGKSSSPELLKSLVTMGPNQQFTTAPFADFQANK